MNGELSAVSRLPEPVFAPSGMYGTVLLWISTEVRSHPSVELAAMKIEEEQSCAYLPLMSGASVSISRS